MVAPAGLTLYAFIVSCSAGLECEVESYCGPVPGRDIQEGKMVGLEPSRCRGDLECGVDGFEPLRMDEGGEPERPEVSVDPTPSEPYIDFAFGLDVATRDYDSPGRTKGPSVAIGLDYPSVSETLRRLESGMEPLTEADTNADITLMNIDTMLSALTQKRLSPAEGEAQCRDLPSNSSLKSLPFHLPALAHSSSSSPMVTTSRDLALAHLDSGSSLKAPVEVRPQTPQISATLSGLELELGYRSADEPASMSIDLSSVEVQEVFTGPSLFLDDDGME